MRTLNWLLAALVVETSKKTTAKNEASAKPQSVDSEPKIEGDSQPKSGKLINRCVEMSSLLSKYSVSSSLRKES